MDTKQRNLINIQYDPDTKEVRCRICSKWKRCGQWNSELMMYVDCENNHPAQKTLRRKRSNKRQDTREHIRKFLSAHCVQYGISNGGILFDMYIRIYKDTYDCCELDSDKFVSTILSIWPHIERDINTLEGISLKKKMWI